jgi:hypothetical protein
MCRQAEQPRELDGPELVPQEVDLRLALLVIKQTRGFAQTELDERLKVPLRFTVPVEPPGMRPEHKPRVPAVVVSKPSAVRRRELLCEGALILRKSFGRSGHHRFRRWRNDCDGLGPCPRHRATVPDPRS